MHTAAKQPPKTASPANPANEPTTDEVLAQLKTIYRIKRLESEVTMIAAQTKAMETLIACMTSIQSTGDTKLDALYARERNRQRLAAIQTLLHIRTVQREKRLRRTMRAKAKAKAERSEPNRASDGSQATKKEMPAPPAPSKGGVVRSEADGHVDNGSTPPSPQRGRRWQPTEGRMTDEGAVDASPSVQSACPAPPPPQPAPPMHPHDARVQELRRLRAEKMARRQAEALDAEQNAASRTIAAAGSTRSRGTPR